MILIVPMLLTLMVKCGTNTETLTRNSNLVNIIMLKDSHHFIQGYQNGNCLFYDENYDYYQTKTCCTDQLLSLDSLNDDCWVFGCSLHMKIYCDIYSTFKKKLNLSNYADYSSTVQYIVAWPYIDIHILPLNGVGHCDVSSYSFSCDSFILPELSSLTTMWVNEYQQSAKVLTANGKSKIFVYVDGSSPFTIDFSQTVYSITQDGYQIYIWGESGIFQCDRGNNQITFTSHARLGFVPSSKKSLVFFNKKLYYINQDKTLRRSPGSSVSSKTYEKIIKYRWGLFGDEDSSVDVLWLSQKSQSQSGSFNNVPTVISKSFDFQTQYQNFAPSTSTDPSTVTDTTNNTNTNITNTTTVNTTDPANNTTNTIVNTTNTTTTNTTNPGNNTNPTNTTDTSTTNTTNTTTNNTTDTNITNSTDSVDITTNTSDTNSMNTTDSNIKNTTNSSNNATDQVNITNITNQTNLSNDTNITNQTNATVPQPVEVVPEATYLCKEGCKSCYYNKTCILCENGYELTNQQCTQSSSFAIATSLTAFPYSALALKMVLVQFMDEFWFYEYHDHQYSKEVTDILETIGNMNRKKFIPIFIKQMVGQDFYDNYQEQKHNWGFSNSTPYTDNKYLSREKQPINFTVVTSKMYIWNYVLTIAFFIMHRIFACLLSGFDILRRPFKRSTVTPIIFMILIQGHVQFITFTFFRQIRNPASYVFLDKVNLVVAVLFMFIALFYTISSFMLYSWFLKKKDIQTLYPFATKNKATSMGLVMFLGPGRNFLLGFFQSLYEDFILQMFLLIGLNLVTLFFLRYLKKTKVPHYFMVFKQGFIVIITIFLVSGLFSAYKFGFTSSSYEVIQLTCICGLWAICVLDFVYGFTSFIIDLIHQIKQKRKINKIANDTKKIVKKKAPVKKQKITTKKQPIIVEDL